MLHDFPCDFMAQNTWSGEWLLSFHHVQVGMAHTAGCFGSHSERRKGGAMDFLRNASPETFKSTSPVFGLGTKSFSNDMAPLGSCSTTAFMKSCPGETWRLP